MSEFSSHILLPTDLDTDLWEALQLALQFGLEPQSRVTFLHVTRTADLREERVGLDAFGYLHSALHLPHESGGCAPSFSRHVKREFRNITEKLNRKLHPEWSEYLTLDAVCRSGDVTREILDYAKETGVDTIVLHAKPRAGWWKRSARVADEVMRQAHCRVVLVRHPDWHPSASEEQERRSLFDLSRLFRRPVVAP